jgi:hypothetical protein
LLSSSSNQVLAKAGNPGTSISRSVVVSSESVTTTACNKIRFDKYRARLDLFYFYTVVFSFDAPVGAVVTGIENAIAHAVASSLDSCDDQERPMYAAKLSLAGHAVADGSKFLSMSLHVQIAYPFIPTRSLTLHFYASFIPDSFAPSFDRLQRDFATSMNFWTIQTSVSLSAERRPFFSIVVPPMPRTRRTRLLNASCETRSF